MKIGIDSFGCEHGKSGLGSFLINLVENLTVEFTKENNLKVELFGSELDRYTYAPSSENTITYNSVSVDDTYKAELKWHLTKCAKFCKRNNYDYVIFPAAEKYLPKKFLVPSVAVINTPFSIILARKNQKKLKTLKKSLLRVEKIVAGSKFIKDDLIDHGIPEEKIRVIKSGIDHKLFFPGLGGDDEYIDAKPFSIKKPYFIYSTKLSGAAKNHENLIKAFSLLKKQTGCPHRLVIAGSEGEYSQIVHELAYNCEYASDILLTGFFPRESLPMLYSGSAACIFPADGEGVGLPVMESMACGIPVLCSNSGALPEVGGDVPVYFNSADVNEIAEKLKMIIDDPELAAEKGRAGVERSKIYNWSDTVKQIINFICE
ncbi:MAG: glycosyltransferase family 4 protein [Treponema sp.]|nr:glycosyltransferase family 4 protein [Treponema sp.]